MEVVNKTLFLISDGMLIPVMLLLIFFFIRSLMLVGSFFRHAIQRTQSAVKRRTMLSKLETLNEPVTHCKAACTGQGFFDSRVRELIGAAGKSALCDKILADAEIYTHKECEQARILMRVGPMLGLMGTIIPMGPALTGLATGNLSAMALNMQVAFATTVVGLFCGITGFILNSVLRRWYAEEMINLNYVCEVFNGRG
ncbi:MAG: MotA/TolQ/ExbB proton channel family protein [Chitinispirillaceae bacterium]